MSALAWCALVLGAACVPNSAHTRDALSSAMKERVGVGLRDDSETSQRLPPGIELTRALSEDDAVAIALWNNAQFQSDLATLSLSRADLVEAGMIRNPLFNFMFPLGPKQLEFTALIPIEALWQRPRRVEAAQRDVERVATNLVQSGLDLVRTVKLSWADAALAEARVRVAKEGVVVRQRLEKISEARRKAGDISELELITARVDCRRAEQDARRFELEEVAARERLSALLGLADGTVLQLALAEPEPRVLAAPADEVKEALALRPDLRAAELAIEAAHARTGAATASIIPPVSLIADANGAGTQGFEMGPGIQAELPILNQAQGARARAAAELERAQWNYVATAQRIALEVRQAHARYVIAQESVVSLRRDVIGSLDTASSRAAQAFAAGEASYLFVLQTTQQQLDARAREIELVAELRRAAAELDRGIGRKEVHAK
ncbi:MAG: TolC family protein [Archangium sp.]|nr:TolC family protein [Archangium sp.]